MRALPVVLLAVLLGCGESSAAGGLLAGGVACSEDEECESGACYPVGWDDADGKRCRSAPGTACDEEAGVFCRSGRGAHYECDEGICRQRGDAREGEPCERYLDCGSSPAPYCLDGRCNRRPCHDRPGTGPCAVEDWSEECRACEQAFLACRTTVPFPDCVDYEVTDCWNTEMSCNATLCPEEFCGWFESVRATCPELEVCH